MKNTGNCFNVFPVLVFTSFLLFTGMGLGESRADWQQDWAETVKAAKREGHLVAYGGEEITHPQILEAFNNDFPEIKVTTASGHGSELGARILAERRAGKFLVDLYAGGPSTPYRVLFLAKALDPVKDELILPEVTDPSKWYGGKQTYADPKNAYLFMFEGTPSGGATLIYNTKLVNAKEIHSYWDLLEPKWKGKILYMNPTSNSLGLNTTISLFEAPGLGANYIKRLFGEMDVTISGNRRQGTDWLARGRYALCFACRDSERARSQGLPVGDFLPGDLKEGGFEIGGGSSSVIVRINRGPNPNAAKVFLNWYLSRKGQAAWQYVMNAVVKEGSNSMRVDISKDDVMADAQRLRSRQYRIIGFRDPKPAVTLMRQILRH